MSIAAVVNSPPLRRIALPPIQKLVFGIALVHGRLRILVAPPHAAGDAVTRPKILHRALGVREFVVVKQNVAASTQLGVHMLQRFQDGRVNIRVDPQDCEALDGQHGHRLIEPA